LSVEENVKERFEGEAGGRRLVDALAQQKIVAGNSSLAASLAEVAEIVEVGPGGAIIEQESFDNDVYLIIAGSFAVVVNGRRVATRHSGDHVGEMAAVEPTQPRSAAVIALESSLVAKVSEDAFSKLADRYPQIWWTIAKELSRRLRQRNALVTAARERARVVVMSSVEALPIARALQTAFDHDPYLVIVWENGVFRASTYSMEALEEQIDQADFGIVVAAADDVTVSRGKVQGSPRDNVTFELGFFMGRLGRHRALLLEPRGQDIKLPSDLRGLTVLDYVWRPGADGAAELAPTANRLRELFNDLGPIA
jgi:predicted nucleotide-binding protein